MRKLHVIWAVVPVMAFICTPFLPFVNGPYLWLGVPSVLAWCLLWTAGTTAGLALTDRFARPADAGEHHTETETPA
ncbi:MULTISPECIES: hypothetical protein [unclassified Streptomyces]|uniref:hypothetical protein n=1 Tax=unclassified Streptomyces TaxID=2593676 RepID=UPI0013C0079A|nr:hypothetical protein [Streptomyces sp. SID10853]NDZ77840.1 hypothetical protein [Streptomyces sp. SID10853]WSU40081.1 hypothetical protein OG510_01865 [Streptomyces sp. NBC_01089]